MLMCSSCQTGSSVSKCHIAMSIGEVSEDEMDSVVGGQCEGTSNTPIVTSFYMVNNSDEAYSEVEEAGIPSNGFIDDEAVESDGDDAYVPFVASYTLLT